MRTIKDEFGLYSERLFDDMLCRERKRTERSQKPFVMIMIEINRLTKTKDSLRSLIGIFDDCFRESDIKGWYKNRSVIGIICTEAPNTMNEAIKKKVENAIKQTLYPAFRSIPTISSICFPKTETPETPELDRCVYPELKTNNPKKIISEICKRTMDISVASLMLVTCFPVMLIASVLIKLTSPGPVFFRQERIKSLTTVELPRSAVSCVKRASTNCRNLSMFYLATCRLWDRSCYRIGEEKNVICLL